MNHDMLDKCLFKLLVKIVSKYSFFNVWNKREKDLKDALVLILYRLNDFSKKLSNRMFDLFRIHSYQLHKFLTVMKLNIKIDELRNY